MKCIQAELEKKNDKITIQEGAKEEDWLKVCQRFNDDVERIRDVTDIEDYTGLFACHDDKNVRFFYLVKEDKTLYKMKRRRFLENIGVHSLS